MIMKSLWFSTHICATYFHLTITVFLNSTSCRIEHVSLHKIPELRFSEISVTIYQSTSRQHPRRTVFLSAPLWEPRILKIFAWRMTFTVCTPFANQGDVVRADIIGVSPSFRWSWLHTYPHAPVTISLRLSREQINVCKPVITYWSFGWIEIVTGKEKEHERHY